MVSTPLLRSGVARILDERTVCHNRGYSEIYFVILCAVIKAKKALRETQTPRALAVVRFRHRPPATNEQTHRQDRFKYTASLASAQCNVGLCDDKCVKSVAKTKRWDSGLWKRTAHA